MKKTTPRRMPAPTAIALAALAALACASAQAGVTPSGATGTGNGAALGPGNTDIGNVGVFVGNGAPGGLAVDAGSLLRAGSLLIGPSGSGNGDGNVVIDGAGTRVLLVGDGFGPGVINRLGVGEWGRGSLTVSGGAVLDGRADGIACLTAGGFCNNFVGNAAGSDGTFTITGAGSQASFLRGFFVGGLAVFRPPIDGFTFGTPGGSTRGRVNVLQGGTLTTDVATIGLGPGGSSPLGTERSFADVVISGASSAWVVTGGTLENTQPSFSTGTHRNAWATVNVLDGGTLRVQGNASQLAVVNLTSNGGRTDAAVSGTGSAIEFTGESAVLQVGRSLGSATLELRSGGQVRNVWYGTVGRDGSFGTLVIDGAGSLYRADNTATAAANNGQAQVAVMDIGRGGGNGHVTVSNGGRLEIVATQARANGPSLSLGRDAASSGTLTIAGPGSTVLVSAASVGAGPGEAFNPFVRVGRDGSGTLLVSAGGKLLLEGNAVSTPTDTRRTNLFIGGAGDTTPGGRGIATVTGAGSEIRVSGSDTYIGVGHGPLASGQLTLADQGRASATILGVGNFGGTGIVKMDNARVDLSGQYTGQGGFGAALVIGAGQGAVGSLSMANGSVVRIENTLSGASGVTIGGSRALTGGDGALTLSGGSRIEMAAPVASSSFTVGRTGSGLLRLQTGSALDLGGSALYVARASGSDGTLIATGGSTINAGFVGVGRDGANGGVDGGTATMVLNGATLNATDVVIGTNGYLGGSAGAINVSGTITNYGIFSPGASPGVFTINGAYVAAAGSRLILEVESDGNGGFLTDELRFGFGSDIDLGALTVEFRFLGDTDPGAFLASGRFDIDTFLSQADATGTLLGLPSSEFAGVSFEARADAYTIADFSFDVDGGVSFTATPVPEPSTWALLAGGLVLIGARLQRRSSRREAGPGWFAA